MLVSLEEAKTQLQIPLENTSFDNILTQKINAVCALAERYCNRKFTKTDIQERLRQVNGVAFTKYIPINSIENITYDNRAIANLDELEVDYEIGKISGLTDNATIVYNTGLFENTENVNADLKEFCLRKIAELFTFRVSGSGNEGYNNIELNRVLGLNDDDKMFLDYYRLANV